MVLTQPSEEHLSIDRHLPSYDATQIRHVVVEADPETTFEAILHADLTQTGPVVAALNRLRVFPARVAALLGRGEPPTIPEVLTFGDLADDGEWILLEESPGRELVVGAVGTFWRPVIEWKSVDPDAFASFDEPGYAKLAIGFSVRRYGENRSLVTYEARTKGTDPASRRKFLRYWRLIGPFAGYLMMRALDRIAVDARERVVAHRRSTIESDVRQKAVAALGVLTIVLVSRLLARRWNE